MPETVKPHRVLARAPDDAHPSPSPARRISIWQRPKLAPLYVKRLLVELELVESFASW